MRRPPPHPSTVRLWIPFALVGLAAGWLSDGLLANPLVGAIPLRNQGTAAVIAGLVGGGIGALLSRIGSREALGDRPFPWHVLAALVVLGGGLAGALVGGMELGSGWGLLSGGVNGAISSVAFTPVCAVVVAAARRAERARQGSIVAGADRRAVWSVLAAALAVTTLAAALDVPLHRHDVIWILPRAAWLIAGGAAATVIVTLAADVFAWVRVGRLAGADLAAHDPAEARDAGVVPTVDLGLGDDVHAEMGRAANAYRSRARAVALLLGSVGEARAALGRAVLRGVLSLGIAGAVIAGHAWAETPAAYVAYEAARCDRSPASCYEAGMMLLGSPEAPEGCPAIDPAGASLPDPTRGLALLARSCEAGHLCSCAGIEGEARRHGELVSLPTWYVPR